MRRLLSVPIFVLLLVGLATQVGAQGTTSRLLGTVIDATGGVLPGATVTLINQATGVTFTAVTSGTGSYGFEAVPTGAYTVKVELQGFKTFESKDNQVSIGQPTAVNVRLEPGSIAETVNVVAAAMVVQTSTSGNLGTVLTQNVIQAMPIVGTRGRNPLDLVTLQPGVVSGANTGGGVHVNGARDRSWNYTLDGIDVNETSAGGGSFSPLRSNPDSVSEFKVLTGNQTAEYGRNSGGQVAMVTRSGSNQYRGTGFYFRRQPSFNSAEWEGNLTGAKKEQFFQDIGGASIGGPIRKNRTFFFGNLQVLKATRNREVSQTVYTDTARQGIWRFVAGGRNQPFGVAGSPIDANGNVLPGMSIGSYNIGASDPARLGLDPTLKSFIGLTPLPNNFRMGDGLNTAGFTFQPEESEKQYDAVIRIDHVLNEKNFFFGRVAWGEQNSMCDRANGGEPRFPGLPCMVDTFRNPFNFAASWRWNPASSVVNEFVVGLNRFAFDFTSPSDASKVSPVFSGVTMPLFYDWGNARKLQTWQFVDNLSWVTGAHSLKFGMNLRFAQHRDVRGSIGWYNATPNVDFSTSVNTVDPATFGIPSTINTTYDRPTLQNNINFLLGRVGNLYQGFVAEGDQYAPGGTKFDFDARYPEMDFFAQDTWRPRRNLTVDLGLRWELKLTPGNPQGLIRHPNADVMAGASPSNTLKWVKGDLYKSDLNNIAPSIGMAWDPNGDGKSVLRANYRLAYDRINTFLFSSAIFQSIPGITASVIDNSFGQSGGRLKDLAPVLAALQPTFSPESFTQPPAVGSSSMRVVDPNFDSPITHGWAISYQREIMKNTLLEVAYVGRRASHLFGAYNVNQADIFNNGFLDAFKTVQAGGQSALINQLLTPDTRRSSAETGSDMVRRLYLANLNTNNVAGLASALATRVQSGKTLPELAGLGSYFFVPYPQFLGGVIVMDAMDYSRYHALQAKLERRFGGGMFSLGYTLSRSKDTRSFDPAFTTAGGGNSQSSSSTPWDPKNRELNFAPSDFDRLHVVQATAVFELPFGRGKWIGGNVSDVVDRIVGGWDIATAITWNTGRPFTVYAGSNTYTSYVQTPANCNGCSSTMGAPFDDPGTGLVWFFNETDRAKFSMPAPGEFSNVGRNFFRGPWGFNMNLSVAKKIRTFGAQTFEIRMDATNVTNTPSFGFPTATMTSTTFGRIYNSVNSYSRKMQLGLKYSF